MGNRRTFQTVCIVASLWTTHAIPETPPPAVNEPAPSCCSKAEVPCADADSILIYGYNKNWSYVGFNENGHSEASLQYVLSPVYSHLDENTMSSSVEMDSSEWSFTEFYSCPDEVKNGEGFLGDLLPWVTYQSPPSPGTRDYGTLSLQTRLKCKGPRREKKSISQGKIKGRIFKITANYFPDSGNSLDQNPKFQKNRELPCEFDPSWDRGKSEGVWSCSRWSGNSLQNETGPVEIEEQDKDSYAGQCSHKIADKRYCLKGADGKWYKNRYFLSVCGKPLTEIIGMTPDEFRFNYGLTNTANPAYTVYKDFEWDQSPPENGKGLRETSYAYESYFIFGIGFGWVTAIHSNLATKNPKDGRAPMEMFWDWMMVFNASYNFGDPNMSLPNRPTGSAGSVGAMGHVAANIAFRPTGRTQGTAKPLVNKAQIVATGTVTGCESGGLCNAQSRPCGAIENAVIIRPKLVKQNEALPKDHPKKVDAQLGCTKRLRLPKKTNCKLKMKSIDPAVLKDKIAAAEAELVQFDIKASKITEKIAELKDAQTVDTNTINQLRKELNSLVGQYYGKLYEIDGVKLVDNWNQKSPEFEFKILEFQEPKFSSCEPGKQLSEIDLRLNVTHKCSGAQKEFILELKTGINLAHAIADTGIKKSLPEVNPGKNTVIVVATELANYTKNNAKLRAMVDAAYPDAPYDPSGQCTRVPTIPVSSLPDAKVMMEYLTKRGFDSTTGEACPAGP